MPTFPPFIHNDQILYIFFCQKYRLWIVCKFELLLDLMLDWKLKILVEDTRKKLKILNCKYNLIFLAGYLLI